MQVLIIIRDFILAVLLSWVGSDQVTASEKENSEQNKKAAFSMPSGGCNGPIMLLEAETGEHSFTSHSDMFAS
jgi:hypothetical protein